MKFVYIRVAKNSDYIQDIRSAVDAQYAKNLPITNVNGPCVNRTDDEVIYKIPFYNSDEYDDFSLFHTEWFNDDVLLSVWEADNADHMEQRQSYIQSQFDNYDGDEDGNPDTDQQRKTFWQTLRGLFGGG